MGGLSIIAVLGVIIIIIVVIVVIFALSSKDKTKDNSKDVTMINPKYKDKD